MIKEIKEFLSECEMFKDIAVCVSPTAFNSIGIMPAGERLVKKYTDGKKVKRFSFELLYKTSFSPQGDINMQADAFYENAVTEIEKLFKNSKCVYPPYEFIDYSCGDYVLKHSSPSSATYSLSLTFDYLKERI